MTDIRIKGFDIERKLGDGGMSTVWLARQRSLDRLVAIKILGEGLDGEADDVSRFEAEARVAAQLKHQGIVQVFDAGARDGVYFIVMEYVDGYTVGDWMRRKGHLDEGHALDVAECVADALGYAWRRNQVVHCDVKPDNVMVDADGTVKVADLGLARTLKRMHELLPDDEVMGTPAYISPEQATGAVDLDFRADVYSLGATLYHLVSGRMLFQAVPEEEGMEQQVNGAEVDVCEHAEGVSGPFCFLIEKMLAKDPSARHTSWDAVAEDLRRVRDGRMPAGPPIEEGRSTMLRSAKRPDTTTARPVVRVHQGVAVRSDLVKRSAWHRRHYLRAVVMLVLCVGALVGAAVGFRRFWQRGGDGVAVPGVDPLAVAPPAAVAVSVTPVQVVPPADASPHERSRKALAAARVFERGHATQPDQAVERYRQVARQYASFPEAVEAEDAIRALKARMAQEADAIFAKLRSDARKLAEQEKFPAAVAMVTGYEGAYAAQMESARNELAGELRRAERETRAARRTAVFADAAKVLYGGDLAEACALLDRAEKDVPALSRDEVFLKIERIIGEAAAIDQQVTDAFKAEVGKALSLSMSSGSVMRGTLVASANGVLRLDTGGRPRSLVRIRIAQLSLRERLRRMPQNVPEAVSLYKALEALRARHADYARDFLSVVPKELSQPLMNVAGL